MLQAEFLYKQEQKALQIWLLCLLRKTLKILHTNCINSNTAEIPTPNIFMKKLITQFIPYKNNNK